VVEESPNKKVVSLSLSPIPGASIGKEKRNVDHIKNFLQNLEFRMKGKDSPGPG
jgi:hypothetical protein